MRTVKLSMTLIIIIVLSGIVIAVESEEQKPSDVQNTADTQNDIDSQKLAELQKLLELQKLMELQKHQDLQKSLEVQEFRGFGFNSKHYQIAKRMNLDAENYSTYYTNRRNRKKGNRLMGIGSGIATIGLFFAVDGIVTLIKGPEHYNNDDYYNNFSDYIFDRFSIGGTCIGTGLGLFIGGVIKRNKIRDVYTKDGKLLHYN